MATLTPSPRMQFFDANGNPLVGGKLYTYQAGTTTPLATYTNSGGGTANANPVILDSRGEASVWLGTSLYYMELKTSADVLVWTSDNIGGVATLSALAANNGTTLVNGTWFGGVVALLSALATSIGTSLIGFIQAGTGAIARSLQSKLRETVSVKDFGAVGDGVTDDTAAFAAMFALGVPWYIPYTAKGYLISAALTISSDGVCNGRLIAASGFSGRLISITPGASSYQKKLFIEGLYVTATTNIVAGSVGIYCGTAKIGTASGGIVLTKCIGTRFETGLFVEGYSMSFIECTFASNDTNVLIFTTNIIANQCNLLTFMAGQINDGVTYNLRIGTTGAGYTGFSATQGVNIKFIGMDLSFGRTFVDNVANTTFDGCYFERASYALDFSAITLGSAGFNVLQNINISNCIFSGWKNAIYQVNGVNGLVVGKNYYYLITQCALYALGCNQGGTITYTQGYRNNTTCPEVHTGLIFNPLNGSEFNNISLDYDALICGTQYSNNESLPSWYPYGKTAKGKINISSSSGRVKLSGGVAYPGTLSGTAFTFTTLANAYLFNGGDRVTLSTTGAAFVRYVDYTLGIAYLDGGVAGAATLSLDTATFITQNALGFGTPNGVVTANIGSTYQSLAGGANTTLYVKESGANTNTGWVAK